MSYILYKDNIRLGYIYADKHELTEGKGINLYTNKDGIEVLTATMFGDIEQIDNRYKIHLIEL